MQDAWDIDTWMESPKQPHRDITEFSPPVLITLKD